MLLHKWKGMLYLENNSPDMSNLLNNLNSMMDNGTIPDNVKNIINNIKNNSNNSEANSRR